VRGSNFVSMSEQLFSVTFTLQTDALGVWIAIAGIAASFAVAGATLWMAAKTRELSKNAKKEIEVSNEQASAARDAVTAVTRPWIVIGDGGDSHSGTSLVHRAVQVGFQGNTDWPVNFHVWLKNVGPGLALIDPGKCWVHGYGQLNDRNELRPFTNIFTNTPVVPTGADFEMTGRIMTSSANWSGISVEAFCFPSTPQGGRAEIGAVRLDIAYTDVAGKNLVVASIQVVVSSLDGGGPNHVSCRVHRVDYLNGEPLEQFSTTRVGPPE
jgi:hypothetical protein